MNIYSAEEKKSPPIAATLSLIVPGLGQIYNGQVRKGILIFLTAWLILPWIFGVFDAYRIASQVQDGQRVIAPPSQRSILVAGAVFVGFFFITLLVLIMVFFHLYRAHLG
jgi:hypothetical protein